MSPGKERTIEIIPSEPFPFGETIDSDINPAIVAARILQEKELPLTIVYKGRGLAEIAPTSETRLILNRIGATPQFHALFNAYEGRWPEFKECQWPTETERRVKALFLVREASHMDAWGPGFFETLLDLLLNPWSRLPDQRTYSKDLARDSRSEAREILKGLKPLKSQDIHSLLEEVVDKVLAQSSQSSQSS